MFLPDIAKACKGYVDTRRMPRTQNSSVWTELDLVDGHLPLLARGTTRTGPASKSKTTLKTPSISGLLCLG